MAVGRRMGIEAHAQRLRAGISEATPYLSRRQVSLGEQFASRSGDFWAAEVMHLVRRDSLNVLGHEPPVGGSSLATI
jgi:hypothetical protein